MIRWVAWFTALGAMVFVWGCDRNTQPAHTEEAAKDSAAAGRPTDSGLPAGVLIHEEPTGAEPLGAVKADTAREGAVVVRGRIGGRAEPFVLGRAAFTFADLSLVACSEKHNDGCPTPWDYCCEPREVVLANTATIQVVGDDGRPLRLDLQQAAGLKPLAELVIAGRITERAEGGVLVINAERIFVVK